MAKLFVYANWTVNIMRKKLSKMYFMSLYQLEIKIIHRLLKVEVKFMTQFIFPEHLMKPLITR